MAVLRQAGLIAHMVNGWVSDVIPDVDIGTGRILEASMIEGLAREVSMSAR